MKNEWNRKKREGNACEKCEKLDTEVGKITHYTKHGSDFLLCSECLNKREKPYTEICPKCKRIAYEHGGLTYYDGSDADDSPGVLVTDSDNYDGFDFDFDEEPPSFELMCMECHAKKVARVKKIRKTKLTIKNFAKDHWKFWITISISIIVIIIGLSRL